MFTKIFFLFTVATIFIHVNHVESQSCIPNWGNCQPDGSLGNCCSSFCYKQVGWAMGNCQPVSGRMIPEPKRNCIPNWNNCQPDGSMGNCCSGFCYKEGHWAVGICK